MPIETSNLRLDPVRINTPFENLNTVLATRQREQSVRANEIEMRQAEQGEQDRQAIQQIWQQYGNDPEKAIEMTYGVNPTLAGKIKTDLQEATLKGMQAHKAQLEMEAAQTDKHLRRLAAIPDGDDEALAFVRDSAAKDDPELVQLFPQTIRTPEGKAQLQRLKQLGMSAKDQLEADAKRLAHLETIAGQARGQDITMRGQDVSADTARRGQDITEQGQQLSASTQRRGQDLSASTQRRGQDLGAAQAAARLAFEQTKPHGADGGLKLSAGQQQELEGMLTMQDLSKDVLELGRKTKWSGVGYYTGTLSGLGGRGTNDEKSLRNKINNIKATIAKVRGGTAFTPNEQKLLDSYTPSVDDADSVIEQKLVDLDDFVTKKRVNMLKIASGDYSPNQAATGSGTVGPYSYTVVKP